MTRVSEFSVGGHTLNATS